MRKLINLLLLTVVALTLAACEPTPAELAERSIALHLQMVDAKTEDDSIAIFQKITEVESQARQLFTKQQLREYERLAHPVDSDGNPLF